MALETAPAPPKLRALNALRFVAAAGVFADHLKFFKAVPAVAPFYREIMVRGHAGVTFFFILSGFILAYTYVERLPGGGPGRAEAIERFYVARVARIYPVHLLTIGVAIAAGGWATLRGDLPELVANLLLVHSWVPMAGILNTFNGPSWTLCHEAFFYVLFPVLLPAVMRARPGVLIAVLLAAYGGLVALGWSQPTDEPFFFAYFPPTRLIEFVLGIGMFRLHRGLARGAGATIATFTLLEAGSIGLVFLSAMLARSVPGSVSYSLVYVPAFALTILVFAQERGALARWLSRPAWFHLGEISYSFYMFHLLVIIAALGLLPLLGPYGVAAFAFTATVAVSHVCFRWFEAPMRDRINRWRPRLHEREKSKGPG